MKKRAYLAGLLAVVMGLGIPNGFAHGRSAWMMSKEGCLGADFFHEAYFLIKSQDKLGLSEEQVQTIKDLKLEVKKNLIRHQAEIKVQELDIQAQLRGNKAELEAIQTLIDQKYEAEKNEAKSMAAAYLKLKAVLNPKQAEALAGLQKEQMKQFESQGSDGEGHSDR